MIYFKHPETVNRLLMAVSERIEACTQDHILSDAALDCLSQFVLDVAAAQYYFTTHRSERRLSDIAATHRTKLAQCRVESLPQSLFVSRSGKSESESILEDLRRIVPAQMLCAYHCGPNCGETRLSFFHAILLARH